MKIFRKYPVLATALTVTLLCLLRASIVVAQIAPPTPPAAVQAPPASLPTSYPHGYLAEKVQLTYGSRIFYVTRKDLGFSFADGVSDLTVAPSAKFVIDQSVLTSYLTSIKPRIDSPGYESHPVLVSPPKYVTRIKSDNVPRPAVIVPSIPSTQLLVPQSAQAITSAIAQNPLANSIPLTVAAGNPPGQGSSLTGIDSRLAHFVTHFDPYEVGRTQTVKRAIQLVNGYVLAPGETFSINRVVGVRTAARGFGVGKVFINGTMQDQVGGGMCQVATTLYNAALLANLKIVERHPHARTVPYVPAGGDATVYYGQKDFQFQNNTATPIYIAYVTIGDYCVVDLYGKGKPDVSVRVETTATRLGERYYTGLVKRYVTEDGKTTNDYTSFSSYKWTPSLDYLR